METGIDGEIELWHRAMDEWKRSIEELVTTETKEGEQRTQSRGMEHRQFLRV
jgi:hypothetical protein